MSKELEKFIATVAKLRAPDGCPWDKEQTHETLRKCLLDETYELLEAIDENSPEKMREELGDVLLQVALHAQIASEENKFSFDDVAKDITDKLIRRHPHVFGDVIVNGSHEVLVNWEKIKKEEKKRESHVDDIPDALPALFKAEKIQHRVAKVGFDWPNTKPVLDKVEEEFKEFREALEKGDHDNAQEELGDILFALVNVARHHKICAEDALRGTITKFGKRFKFIEQELKKLGKDVRTSSLQEMDKLWEESKSVVG